MFRMVLVVNIDYFHKLHYTGCPLYRRRSMFPVRYSLNYYILFSGNSFSESRVEAGSNTSTVALRVVGGDEKGVHCLGVYLGHRAPGGI
jgi:hypothetical protein